MSISIQTSTTERVCRVAVSGEIDVSNAGELRTALDEALARAAVMHAARRTEEHGVTSEAVHVGRPQLLARHRRAEQFSPLAQAVELRLQHLFFFLVHIAFVCC